MSATTRARLAPRVTARVVNHGIESDRDRRVQSQDHLPQGIAHEQDVDPGSIQEPGHGGVVGGQHDDSFAASLHRRKIGRTDLPRWASHGAVLLSMPGVSYLAVPSDAPFSADARSRSRPMITSFSFF